MKAFARNGALAGHQKENTKMKTAGRKNKTTSNRVALYGLLIALAFVLSYIETLFPVYLGAPGVKLGLANVIVIIMLYFMDAKSAFFVSLIRVLLSGLLFAGFAGFVLIGGGVIAVVLIVKRKKSRGKEQS